MTIWAPMIENDILLWWSAAAPKTMSTERIAARSDIAPELCTKVLQAMAERHMVREVQPGFWELTPQSVAARAR